MVCNECSGEVPLPETRKSLGIINTTEIRVAQKALFTEKITHKTCQINIYNTTIQSTLSNNSLWSVRFFNATFILSKIHKNSNIAT